MCFTGLTMKLSAYLEKNPTQDDFALKMDVSPSLVSYWLSGKRRITAERAVQIETITDGAVPREELRPDLFKV